MKFICELITTGVAGAIGTFDIITWNSIDTIPDNNIFTDLAVTGKYVNSCLGCNPTVALADLVDLANPLPAYFEWEYEHYYSDYYVGLNSDQKYAPLKFLYTTTANYNAGAYIGLVTDFTKLVPFDGSGL